jgi:DNA-binding transcriptional regulator YdaS (Cro superfamily)
MTPKDLIAFFGSLSAVARALGCKPQTVSGWIEAGEVPEGRQYQAELATEGRLRAARPALRDSHVEAA